MNIQLCAILKIVFVVLLQTNFVLLHVSAAEHKIVVIADPHVMAEELLIKDGKAFQKYLSRSRKMIDYSQSLFDQMIEEIINMSPRPELVLIVGDLSKDGELASHRYVKRKLDFLKRNGIPTLIVPGNHDWGTRAVAYSGEKVIESVSCVRFGYGENSLETIYAGYGFRTYYKDSTKVSIPVDRESKSSTLTYVCEPIPGLALVGIDSGKKGELSNSTLNWVCSRIRKSLDEGKRVIAMMHHSLIPHIIGGSHVFYPSKKEDHESGNIGYTLIRNRLADVGLKVIITGNTHNQDIAKDWNSNLKASIYDVSTGSICCYPFSYRVLVFNDKTKNLSVTSSMLKGTALSLRGNTISLKEARARFTQPYIINRIKSKLITLGMNKDEANKVSPYVARAYIYHAEGDETENKNARALLSKLDTMLVDAPSYLKKVNSMLQDLSNYGVVKRENHTEDKNLIINLKTE